jgi:LysM repeat protein
MATRRTTTPTNPPTPETPADDTAKSPTIEIPTHEVAEGETLADIAKKHETSVERLQVINAIKSPESIWPGMTLVVK